MNSTVQGNLVCVTPQTKTEETTSIYSDDTLTITGHRVFEFGQVNERIVINQRLRKGCMLTNVLIAAENWNGFSSNAYLVGNTSYQGKISLVIPVKDAVTMQNIVVIVDRNKDFGWGYRNFSSNKDVWSAKIK